jgi:secreted trypsin-like serine protease
VAPWNSGDFIRIGTGTDAAYCTSGVTTHTVSSGHRYFITAAHCWDGPTQNVNNVYNGYIDASGGTHTGAGQMGVLSLKDVSANDPSATMTNPTTDSAIVDAQTYSTSDLVFNGAWNGTSKTNVLGTRSDVVGAQVCNGGAYSGETCGLTIQYAGVTRCLTNGGCVYPVGEVWNTSANTSAAGHGDSGGPVYSYSGSSVYEQGMVSFGGSTTVVTCPSSNLNFPGRVCYHVLYYTEIGAILSLYGQAVNTN